MKKRLLSLLFTASPLAVLAEEEAGAAHSGWTTPIWGVPMIAWQLANLALVIVLFYYLLKDWLPAFFKSRAIEIENALKKAKEEETQAKQKLAELEEKMAGLEAEIAQIQKEALQATEREKILLRKKADENAGWLKTEAEEEFKRREREAERRLREVAVDEAIRQATAIIEQNFKEEDRERVFSEFSKDLKENIRD